MIDYKAIQENLVQDAENLKKGYDTLQEIGSVELAELPRELVWQQDKVKLYHYTRDTKAKSKVPVLVSYALMNRPSVLDLQKDRSMLARMLDEGLDVYMIDWGYPSKNDRYLTLGDYILGYWDEAIDHMRDTHEVDSIHMVSICQAGTFSMIYASLNPEKVKTLTTIVSPFDFDVEGGMLYTWSKDIDVDSFADAYCTIPAPLLNTSFSMLHPSLDIRKYFGIMKNLDNKEKLENFLRMEIWKADCPDLSSEMYRKYINDLFKNNLLIQGKFEIDGHTVDLKNITMPYLNIYATEDTIIPNESTLNVMDYIGSKDSETFEIPGGHIGVFVGSRSQKLLAPKIAEFVIKRSK